MFKREVLGRFLVVISLRNSDQGCFGSLLMKYCEAYAGQEDKYPSDVNTMLDILRS